MKKLLLIFILVFMGYRGLYTADIPVTGFCLQYKMTYQENLKLNYIELSRGKHRFRLFVTMPYISYKGQVHYMPHNLHKDDQGQWLMPSSYGNRILELMEGKTVSETQEHEQKIVSEQWIHEQNQDSQKKHNNQKKTPDPLTQKKEPEQTVKKTVKTNKTAETHEPVPPVKHHIEGFVPIDSVIIDAGHGGKDPGAIGKNGIKEKVVVLEISHYLQQYLKADKDLHIFMTRSKDNYVSLEHRTQYATKKARKYNPLFVSIHGNMSLSRKSSGIEVFSLSDKASDDQALQVEMMENEGFHSADIKKTDALFVIIAGLVRDGLKKESSYLADKVYAQLLKYTGAKKRGLKKANFYVLKYNTVPAILVEVGFLSHPQEGGKLATQDYQKKIARGLYYGIKNYVEQYNKTKGFSQ